MTLLSDIAAPVSDEAPAVVPAPEGRRAARLARRGRTRRIVGWVVLALAVVLLWPAQFGGLTGLTVVNGHSMEPTYVTGDLILSVRQPSYAVGDIVSYRIPEGQDGAGGRVIHRIAAVDAIDGGTRYETRGDNNPEADPWRFGDGDILGRAVLRVPGVGTWLTPDGSPWLLALALGAVVTLLLWGDDRAPRRREDEPEDGRR